MLAEVVRTPRARLREDEIAPAFSLIMPAHGTRAWIGEAIESVRAQTLTDWELIVVDDGSPDGLAEVVAPLLRDERITLIRQANAGASAARNVGAAQSRAPLLSFIDSDDVLAPDFLERTASILASQPGVGIVGCLMERFDERPGDHGGVAEPALGQFEPWWDTPHCLAEFLTHPFAYHGATMRRSLFEVTGGYSTDLAIHEDFEIWLKVIASGGRPHILPSPHYFWRENPDSVTRSESEYNVRLPESRAIVLDRFLRSSTVPTEARRVARAQRAKALASANLGSARAALRAGSHWRIARCALRSIRARPSIAALRLLASAPLPAAVLKRIAATRS